MILWAAQNAVVALVLAIAVAIVCRAARLGPASRHALWLVVLVKLVTPPVFTLPWAVPILSHPRHAVASVHRAQSPFGPHARPAAELRSSAEAKRDYVVSSEVITLEASSGEEQTRLPDIPATVAVAPRLALRGDGPLRRVDWQWLVHIVWVGGAFIVAGLHVVRIVRMQGRIIHTIAGPEWLVREVADAAARLRIRPPRVVLASGIPSPLVWAFGRGTLLWPAGLSERGQADSWRGVIVHELAHLRRRDHWTSWLELAASCIWWFNPVFWYARCQVRENAELACDAWVVRTLPDGRRSYAEALLAVCEFDPQTVPPPLAALGVQSGARRAFERRLTMILRERLPVRVSLGAWIAAALLAAVAVPNWYLIARAQDAVEEADPQLFDPTTPEAAAAVESLLQEPSSDVDSLPVDPGASVRVPDGGRVLVADPDPASLLPSGSEPPFVEQTPTPREYRQPPTPDDYDDRRSRRRQPTHVVDSDSFTFTRTTYRVPENVAANLTGFLKQNLSWPHLMGVEVRPGANGEEGRQAGMLLIVTASPNAQEVIGNLIGMMLESKPRETATPVPVWEDSVVPTTRPYEEARPSDFETEALRPNRVN